MPLLHCESFDCNLDAELENRWLVDRSEQMVALVVAALKQRPTGVDKFDVVRTVADREAAVVVPVPVVAHTDSAAALRALVVARRDSVADALHILAAVDTDSVADALHVLAAVDTDSAADASHVLAAVDTDPAAAGLLVLSVADSDSAAVFHVLAVADTDLAADSLRVPAVADTDSDSVLRVPLAADNAVVVDPVQALAGKAPAAAVAAASAQRHRLNYQDSDFAMGLAAMSYLLQGRAKPTRVALYTVVILGFFQQMRRQQFQ